MSERTEQLGKMVKILPEFVRFGCCAVVLRRADLQRPPDKNSNKNKCFYLRYKMNQYVGVQVLGRGTARPIVINYCQGAAQFAHTLPPLNIDAIFLPAQAERNQPGCILAPSGLIVPNIAYEMTLNGETLAFRCAQYMERSAEFDLLSWIAL